MDCLKVRNKGAIVFVRNTFDFSSFKNNWKRNTLSGAIASRDCCHPSFCYEDVREWHQPNAMYTHPGFPVNTILKFVPNFSCNLMKQRLTLVFERAGLPPGAHAPSRAGVEANSCFRPKGPCRKPRTRGRVRTREAGKIACSWQISSGDRLHRCENPAASVYNQVSGFIRVALRRPATRFGGLPSGSSFFWKRSTA